MADGAQPDFTAAVSQKKKGKCLLIKMYMFIGTIMIYLVCLTLIVIYKEFLKHYTWYIWCMFEHLANI